MPPPPPGQALPPPPPPSEPPKGAPPPPPPKEEPPAPPPLPEDVRVSIPKMCKLEFELHRFYTSKSMYRFGEWDFMNKDLYTE